MKSFDDIEVNDCTWKAYSDDYYRGYEAGQQSKQSEIDELQKRIDEAVYDLQHIESAMWEEQVEHVLMVLKGDQS